jgi:type VI secretion system protein ImpE
MHTGPVGHVFLPVLYAGSSQHVDERIRLGRMTNWQSVGAGLMRGLGQHMFLVGDEDATLLEVRNLEFQVDASTAT